MIKDAVTILISTYNGSAYITEQLNSVKNQTYTPYKVIIKDDASSDATSDIVRNFINDNRLNNWVLIINNENIGWKANFASLVSFVETEYFMFCDQDDIWHIDKIQKMLAIMKSHPDIELLASNYHAFYEDETDKSDYMVTNNNNKQIVHIADKNCLLIRYPGCVLCYRFSLKSVFDKYWEPEIPHDALIISSAMLRDSFYSYNEELIEYRRHIGTATHSKIRNKQERIEQLLYYYHRLDICEKIYADYGKKSKTGEELSLVRRWVDNRMKVITKRSLFSFLKSFMFIPYYWSPKTIIGDLIYSIKC